jgi:hypothetical protein
VTGTSIYSVGGAAFFRRAFARWQLALGLDCACGDVLWRIRNAEVCVDSGGEARAFQTSESLEGSCACSPESLQSSLAPPGLVASLFWKC